MVATSMGFFPILWVYNLGSASEPSSRRPGTLLWFSVTQVSPCTVMPVRHGAAYLPSTHGQCKGSAALGSGHIHLTTLGPD